jgi:hypothetical protein
MLRFHFSYVLQYDYSVKIYFVMPMFHLSFQVMVVNDCRFC